MSKYHMPKVLHLLLIHKNMYRKYSLSPEPLSTRLKVMRTPISCSLKDTPALCLFVFLLSFSTQHKHTHTHTLHISLN